MSAENWVGWLTATPEQQQEMWRRYRAEVKRESDEARANKYKRMDDAMREAGHQARGGFA